MSDCEDITSMQPKKLPKHKKPSKLDKDDSGGMFINMGKHVDVREVFILWVVFVFLHTEMFADYFLKKIHNATNEDCTLTMKGTFISSVLMVLAIIICSIVF